MPKITLKAIQSGIVKITTDRQKLQAHVHTVAMMIFLHTAPQAISPDANGTGDCSEMVNLIKAIPGSWGTQMLTWMKAVSPMRVNVSTGKYGYDPAYKALDDAGKLASWKLELANTTPFYDFTPEDKARDDSFTVEKMIAAINAVLKRAEKAGEDAKIPANQSAAVAAAVKMLGAIDLKPLIPAADNTNSKDKAVA